MSYLFFWKVWHDVWSYGIMVRRVKHVSRPTVSCQKMWTILPSCIDWNLQLPFCILPVVLVIIFLWARNPQNISASLSFHYQWSSKLIILYIMSIRETGRNITPSQSLSDGVLGFLKGAIIGSGWGICTPFFPQPSCGSLIARRIHAIGSNGLFLGGVVMTFQISSSAMYYIRRKEDNLNYVAGFCLTSSIWGKILTSDVKRAMYNRIAASTLVGCVVYANVNLLHQV